jgi:hypothetical protein
MREHAETKLRERLRGRLSSAATLNTATRATSTTP